MNNNINKNQDEHNNNPEYTVNSVESIPEISKKHSTIFKISFILICLIIGIIGIIILIHNNQYLNSNLNFPYRKPLIIFILIYICGPLTCLLISMFISLPIYCINKLYSHYKRIEDENLSYLTYSLALAVLAIIVLYFCAVPYGIFLIIKMFQNDKLKQFSKFSLLYIFILLNIIIGVLLIIIFLYSLISNKTGNSARMDVNLFNTQSLERAKKEIKEMYEIKNKVNKKKKEDFHEFKDEVE